MRLADRECVPCRGGVPPLSEDRIAQLLAELNHGWEIEGGHLCKTYRFANFRDALACTNRIGELAESVQHHPDIWLAWGRVRIEVWTHKINGLTETDFVFCAKCDERV